MLATIQDALRRWRQTRALHRNDLPEAVRAYLATPLPAASSHWRDARYLALDFETTGLDPQHDAIIQAGVVAVECGRVRLDSAWHTLVRPPAGQPVKLDAIRVHGLLPEQVAKAPELPDVLLELLPRLAGHLLLVHVGAVDLPFLDRALRRCYGWGLESPALDTAALALAIDERRRLIDSFHAERQPRRLPALARAYSIPVAREHDALADAITTAQLFLAQAQALEAFGIRTVGGLRRVSA
jgi:DNA polymerase-3 subunit epsilon